MQSYRNTVHLRAGLSWGGGKAHLAPRSPVPDTPPRSSFEWSLAPSEFPTRGRLRPLGSREVAPGAQK